MLESALAAPRQLFVYSGADLFDLAACYGHRLASNHPFLDGNKRTAWVCSRLFLRLNSADIIADPQDKLAIMLGVARGEVSQAEFGQWLKRHARQD